MQAALAETSNRGEMLAPGAGNLWAGGGITPGRCIGATDRRGEDVIQRHCNAGDFCNDLSSSWDDSSKVFIKDLNGRPPHR